RFWHRIGNLNVSVTSSRRVIRAYNHTSLQKNEQSLKEATKYDYLRLLALKRYLIQSMQTSLGQPKGLKSILTERGLWISLLYLKGARQTLSEKPDFLEQREWLQEIVEQNSGFKIDYYPNFHCEFNFIEMY
ncbi:hypothetical protein OnM2_043011, partial [Erysiphe neolycopersici]